MADDVVPGDVVPGDVAGTYRQVIPGVCRDSSRFIALDEGSWSANMLVLPVAPARGECVSFFFSIRGKPLLVVVDWAVLKSATQSDTALSDTATTSGRYSRKESPSMAKRKRASHEKPFARSMQKSETEASEVAVAEDAASPQHGSLKGSLEGSAVGPAVGADESLVAPFVGKWNQLISTTNWEKGQIICEWREALMAAGAAVTEYSDEAWAQTVGGVTSQHVGRLRRVSERFGDVVEQYEGLHWSHFQACLDWDDAEMWLEGSIQNGWSVSQMRGSRWETVGASPEQQQAEVEQLAAEQKSEADAEEEQAKEAAAAQDAPFESSPSNTQIEPFGGTVADESSDSVATDSDTTVAEPVEKRIRLSVDVASLPDDLAEAFESFKLAIIAHRRENWRDTTPASVVECLDSLKQLALADSE